MRMCLEFTGFFLLISILSQVNGGKLLVSDSEKPPTLSEVIQLLQLDTFKQLRKTIKDMEAQNGELERRILIVEDEKKDSLNQIEQQKTQIKEDLEGKILDLEIEMIQMKEELKQKLYEAQTKCQGEKDALDQEYTEELIANTSLTTNLINSNWDTIEQQARMIQMQSKSISLLRPLMGSNRNKTDILCFNKAEDGAILETSSCGCLPRATQPTSLMPSRIEYLCEGEGNRSYSLECESGVCGTEEFPSCEETVLWENETVLWDNCQEVNFNGITHLCGEGSMEERKTKTIGAGLMTEVVSTPCGDCGDLSTALDWQPWGSCMDGEGNVDRPDIQCRKRGNGKIGFQEEEREPVLLHTDSQYKYYKVPVQVGLWLTSATVMNTCTIHGMKPQCYRTHWKDDNCVLSPGTDPSGEMAKILCNGDDSVARCKHLANVVFWYMNQGSAWGNNASGGGVYGKDVMSTSSAERYTICVRPI